MVSLYSMGLVDQAIHLTTTLEQDKKFDINNLPLNFPTCTILHNWKARFGNFNFTNLPKLPKFPSTKVSRLVAVSNAASGVGSQKFLSYIAN